MSNLPIDAMLPVVRASLERTPNLVIEAAPGAGKTTRVPVALLAMVPGEVVVLEPRRIAARLAAQRVALELGEETGRTVGYQVRFEDVSGRETRLRFVTEGVLTRRLLSDPELSGVSAVIFDEFHERHLDGDLALALLRRLQRRRPELRIVVMSATLDAAPIARYLGQCPVLRSEGRAFPLAIEHLPHSPDMLAVQVRRAVERLLADGQAGHILVFLPGAAEIRQTMRACEGVARRAELLSVSLHGDLSTSEQDLAVGPSVRRKLILATNVAESSVTIDGVSAVIDSGLARIATCSHWTGLPTLAVGRVSKASAKQRAGRAGRTGPGRVYRLYPEEDYKQRRESDVPEILRSDLAQVCLALRAAGIAPAEMEWLDAPPAAAMERAEALLEGLGATAGRAGELARYPLPPRLARMLVEAVERGVGGRGCGVAALLGSGTRVRETELLRAMELKPEGKMLEMEQQLRRLTRRSGRQETDDEALLLSVLAGHPDRVARVRGGRQVMLASGVMAELAGEAPGYEFMVALAVEDRPEEPLPMVRMTSRVEPEWLLDLFPERLREECSLIWDRGAERVDAMSTLLYDQMPIEESREGLPDATAAANLLAEKAMDAGLERFVDEEALRALEARVEFAGLPQLDVEEALREACSGLRSFAQLEAACGDLLSRLERARDAEGLRAWAPASVRLAGGRQVKVNYERNKAPWIESRLQDFFGMSEVPRVGREGTAVVAHLLAPNGRAVQTTSDLAGFWTKLYPTVRRELMRRYPRHGWPERL